MSTQESLSIAGGWLGTYQYLGADAWRPPCRFEATFTLLGQDGRFTGTVLDDGRLGEAGVTGLQEGLLVRFTKVYFRPDAAEGETAPVQYEGTLSEDGRFLHGVWQLEVRAPGRRRPVRTYGVWDAHRLWSSEEEVAARVEEEADFAGAVYAISEGNR